MKPATDPVAELPTPAPEFIDAETIRKPNGMVVRYYRVNAISPELLRTELDRWKTKTASIVAMGPGYPAGFKRSKDGRSLQAVIVQSLLRIEEHEDNWPVLQGVIDRVDVPQPQVYIEARIVEVTHGDDLRIGLDASNIRTDRPVGDLFFKRFDVEFENKLSSGVSSLTLGSADKFVKFDYVLQLGKAGARAEVLSQPGIVAQQGEPAEIFVGEDEPIVTQNLNGNNVTATTKFQPVGLTLRVTPLLIGRDTVRASVAPEVSRISEFRTTATSTDRDVINPVIATRRASTVVDVPDGETLVISGLTQETEIQERSGIPILMDIPVLGRLFGQTTERSQRTELVFFVTFKILRPGDGRVIVPPVEKLRTENGND